MNDMIQVTRQLHKRHCFNPNGFEKTECVGKKLKNIAPNSSLTVTNKIAYRPNQKKLYIC